MRSLLLRLMPLVVIIALSSGCGAPAAQPSQATAATQPTSAPVETAAPPAATEAPVATAAPATAAPAATSTVEPAPTTAPSATSAPTATTEPSPTETTPAVAAADAPQGQGAYDLLLEAGKAQLAQKAWRATITITGADGKETQTVMEFVKPDSVHMLMPTQEIIIVKDGTYMRQGSGAWAKSPVDMSGMITDLLSQQGFESAMKDIKYEDIKLVGADIIGGKPAWIYQYKSSMDVGGTQVATESKTWIGALDKLPYRIEGESDAGDGAKTKVTGVYEYPDNITIEAPKVTG